MATLAGPPGPWRFPVACCPAETADRSPSTCGQYLQSLNPGFNKMQPRNHILLPGFWCTYKYKYKDPRYPPPPRSRVVSSEPEEIEGFPICAKATDNNTSPRTEPAFPLAVQSAPTRLLSASTLRIPALSRQHTVVGRTRAILLLNLEPTCTPSGKGDILGWGKWRVLTHAPKDAIPTQISENHIHPAGLKH
jgi:hypothetical protein